MMYYHPTVGLVPLFYWAHVWTLAHRKLHRKHLGVVVVHQACVVLDSRHSPHHNFLLAMGMTGFYSFEERENKSE